MSKKLSLTDNDREKWILNLESLYADWQHSKMSLRKFVQTNRQMIDDTIQYEFDKDKIGTHGRIYRESD